MNQAKDISKEVHQSMRESRAGRIWFTKQSLNRLARLIGLNYDSLHLGGRLQFKLHCVEIAAFRMECFRPKEYYLNYRILIGI